MGLLNAKEIAGHKLLLSFTTNSTALYRILQLILLLDHMFDFISIWECNRLTD